MRLFELGISQYRRDAFDRGLGLSDFSFHHRHGLRIDCGSLSLAMECLCTGGSYGDCMQTRVLRDPFLVTETIRLRFESKSSIQDSGCIRWTGAINPSGYGKVRINTQKMDAHVAAWRIANGGIAVPVGTLVMHSCDNRWCVNSAHLSLGSSSSNMQDCSAKGRLFTARGQHAYNAKLNDDVVRMLRCEYAAGGISGRSLAKKHGLNYSGVRAVLQGRTWKHVTDEVQS